jgi:uncharacterized protein YutE (UPF0331/DUF86 family)
VDHALVRRHLFALDQALARLQPRASISLDDYLADAELQWAIERGLLVCAQNILDIAAHIAASAGRDSVDYASSIDSLTELGMLPRAFAQQLRPIAGFRNVLVHAYLTVDARLVHQELTSKLPELRQFSHQVERYLGA